MSSCFLSFPVSKTNEHSLFVWLNYAHDSADLSVGRQLRPQLLTGWMDGGMDGYVDVSGWGSLLSAGVKVKRKFQLYFLWPECLSLRRCCVCVCFPSISHSCIISSSISMPDISAVAPQYSPESALLKILLATVNLSLFLSLSPSVSVAYTFLVFVQQRVAPLSGKHWNCFISELTSSSHACKHCRWCGFEGLLDQGVLVRPAAADRTVAGDFV